MKHHFFLTALAAALAAPAAFAQTTIDQNKALAGNVTPGDAPGFPITIKQPGSYKLTGNLTVPPETKGIVVEADGVTLDLNGFTISGPGSCTRDAGTLVVTCSYLSDHSIGIDTTAATGTAVSNGTVQGFGYRGVDAGRMGRYDRLRLTQNGVQGFYGIGGSGGGSIVSNCTIDLNRHYGVYMSVGLISSSRVSNNGGRGIEGSTYLIVGESQVNGNREHGLVGLTARGTAAQINGLSGNNNRLNVTSVGGNIDNGTPF